MSWYLDSNNKLTHDDLPEPIDGVFSEPYPATFWRLDSDSKLTLNSEDWSPFPEPIYDILTSPYPATMWYLDENNKLKNSLLPAELINDSGAFNKNPNLTEVSIPSTARFIGPYAFNDTGLSVVELPDECGYYATSFPQDCTVTGGHLIE